ncbi:YcxB family protein [Streptomyces sp. 061-3]|uniref:YcxB family protein n=1 Tax=Streptomyces sp. 061-3 TaxID=2789268 RepID=UPI0039815FF4
MENEERETAPGPDWVELAYLPTRAEMAEALRARTRTSPAALWRLPLIAVLITVAVLVGLLMLEVPKGMTAAAVMPVLLAVLGSLAVGWVHHQYRVRQMTRYARAQGGYTMRADDDGVYGATAFAETRIPWASFRHYIETVNLFVLVIDDTVGGMTLLPKRGLRDGADVDGMRAVVARHLPPCPSGS